MIPRERGIKWLSHFNIFYSTIIVSMERRGYMSFFGEGNVVLDFQVVNIQTYLVGCFVVLILLLHSLSSFVILWFTRAPFCSLFHSFILVVRMGPWGELLGVWLDTHKNIYA
jgi:hypothetical protein